MNRREFSLFLTWLISLLPFGNLLGFSKSKSNERLHIESLIRQVEEKIPDGWNEVMFSDMIYTNKVNVLGLYTFNNDEPRALYAIYSQYELNNLDFDIYKIAKALNVEVSDYTLEDRDRSGNKTRYLRINPWFDNKQDCLDRLNKACEILS